MSGTTIKQALEWARDSLETGGAESPGLAAQWLLTAATGLSRSELHACGDQLLTVAQNDTLGDYLKRHLAGEPLQYCVGKAAFRYLEFRVRPGVLIPRPETEVLVDTVIADLQKRRAGEKPCGRSSQAAQVAQMVCPARVLDLCTGTGCIALSLLYECPDTQVVATDIDSVAIESIRENARELGFDEGERLKILHDDLACSLLADEANRQTFDVVVSNPPYIPTSELEKLPNEVANYEPRRALDGGTDGLEVFRRIVEQARVLLAPHGLLACELHEETLEQARAICEAAGFSDVRIHPDLTTRPRIITALNDSG
ncbi:MAG: peptide chain release factor N(5)-glutamine methyltransferase [Coriobacteriales bacterium]|jgi:release factor glutamine methyltransferase|nr:peptide chain release factor N(5)-glutamine methyltransferase [Coriobacteriales bacterium]